MQKLEWDSVAFEFLRVKKKLNTFKRRKVAENIGGQNNVDADLAINGASDHQELDRGQLSNLILAIATDKDREAFKTLYLYFAPRLKGYLMRIGSSPSQAEEIVQDVMLTVWRKAPLFDPKKAAPSTWLFTIARNRRIDILRRRKSTDLDPHEPALHPEEPPRPDEEAIRVDRSEKVLDVLKTLPKEQMSLIRLSFYKGWSHSEIAKETGLPLGTVKSRLRLAFSRLRDMLKEVD